MMLIDDRSAVNVLTWEAFRAIGGSFVEMKPIINLIISFYGGTIQLMGSIKLDIELGDLDFQEHLIMKLMQ